MSYTVNNIGAAALTSSTPYDIPIILSTDTTYDATDTVLNVQITGPNLASGSSQLMSSNDDSPSLTAGSYYWIVWADGWDNVTESNDLNNNNYSSSTTTISTSGGTGGDMWPSRTSSIAAATSISSLPLSQSNLSIHTSSDYDFFAVGMISGVTYWYNISFTHSNGDLDMDLLDSPERNLDIQQEPAMEAIQYTPTANITGYLDVFGWSSATNTYALTIESSIGGGTPPAEHRRWL